MSMSSGLRTFYMFKPLLPRSVQVCFRRIRAKRILHRIGKERVRPSAANSGCRIEWPNDCKAAVLITHDVETVCGQKLIPDLVAIENDLGIRSCWNFVCMRYKVDLSLLNLLRRAGHEIGIHGVLHDGKLFSTHKIFTDRLVLMQSYASSWKANGFRSPSLLHDFEMLKEIPFSWDSSIPSWDPFQPQPGGCGIYFPFKLTQSCIELPVTLWQDFTLINELQQKSIYIWKEQVDLIYEMGGMINIIIHPDYMPKEKQGMYIELLSYLKRKEGVWFALPHQVAEWAQSTIEDL